MSACHDLLPLFPCQVEACTSSLRPGCTACLQVWCQIHSPDPAFHRCAQESPDERSAHAVERYEQCMSRLQQELEGIAQEAVAIRRAEEGETFTGGCQAQWPSPFASSNNYIIPLVFSDKKWLYRVRRPIIDFPPALETLKMSSALAAMRLAADCGIPVPKVHGEPVADASARRWSFLMDYIPGDYSINHFKTKQAYLEITKMYLQLQHRRFPAMGSPVISDSGTIQVGGLLHPHTTRFQRDGSPAMVEPEICPNIFFANMVARVLSGLEVGIEPIDHPLLIYVMHLDLRAGACRPTVPARAASRRFFLKHADDGAQNWLWNSSNELVGVLDWDLSHITTSEEAFAGPAAFYDVNANYDDLRCLFPREAALAQACDDLGQPALAMCVRSGRKYSLLRSCIGGESLVDFMALRNLVHNEDLSPADWFRQTFDRHSSFRPGCVERVCAVYGYSLTATEVEQYVTALRDEWPVTRAAAPREPLLHFLYEDPFAPEG